MLITVLLTSACAIIGALGLVHLVYTFRTDKFEPRDEDVGRKLRQISPVLTKETSMWKAWVGFNASHSLGALLFALVFGYLALFELEFLLSSPFLVALSLLTLVSFWLLARAYWFSAPFRGISLSIILLSTGYVLAYLQ